VQQLFEQLVKEESLEEAVGPQQAVKTAQPNHASLQAMDVVFE
jgi:hypothetical protein